MTPFNRNIALALIALLAIAGSASAQMPATMTSTTLSTAITDSVSGRVTPGAQRQIVVASATGITAPTLPSSNGSIGGPSSSALTILMVDREAMRVNSVNGTTITVQRGFQSVATTHLSGAKVWVGPASYYSAFAPSGSCTQNVTPVLPRIVLSGTTPNPATGDGYTCWATSLSAVGQWGRLFPVMEPYYGGSQASIAGAQPVTGTIFGISATNAITSYSLPTGFPAGGCFQIIPSAAATATATGDILKASTMVANQLLTYCYNGTGLAPSY